MFSSDMDQIANLASNRYRTRSYGKRHIQVDSEDDFDTRRQLRSLLGYMECARRSIECADGDRGTEHVLSGKPLTAHGAKLLGVSWPT